MRNKAGFTLAEVVMSIIVIGILATGVFSLLSYSKRMTVRMQQKTTAVALVEKKMNELKAGGVPNLPPSGSQSGVTISSKTNTTGTITTTVQDNAGLKEVLVELVWTDPFGAHRTESAVTAFFQE